MDYVVEVVQVDEQLLAAARQRTSLERISKEIRGLRDIVWGFLRENPDLHSDGHNVAVNYESGDRIDIAVGVQVEKRFEPTEAVILSATPAGTAVMTTHFGPFSGLGAAYKAIRSYCQRNGLSLADVSWEVYGDWDEDPKKRRTDIYCLLQRSEG